MRQNPHVRICGGPGSATTRLPDLEKVRLERLVSGTFGVIRVVNDLQTGQ